MCRCYDNRDSLLQTEPHSARGHDGGGGWGYFGHQPEAYVELLQAVYHPIKSEDAEAQIVFGGLAYDAWTGTGGPFVEDFLDKVLLNGGSDHFDVMNFHYYPVFDKVWAPYGNGIIGKTNYLRRKPAAF